MTDQVCFEKCRRSARLVISRMLADQLKGLLYDDGQKIYYFFLSLFLAVPSLLEVVNK